MTREAEALDEETRGILSRINRDFYERMAAEFSATREHPWPGWQRVLRHAVREEGGEDGARTLSILDAGCGNGRLAAFVCAQVDRPLHYVGIDASLALLARARARALPSPAVRFEALFRTPHGVELRAAAELAGAHYARVDGVDSFRSALTASFRRDGLTIVAVSIDAAANHAQHRDIEAAVQARIARLALDAGEVR